MKPKLPPITSWPPKEKPRQVTREELKAMTPQAIEQAREAGALQDLMNPPKAPAGGAQ